MWNTLFIWKRNTIVPAFVTTVLNDSAARLRCCLATRKDAGCLLRRDTKHLAHGAGEVGLVGKATCIGLLGT
jgi:hypothetical protein